MTLQDHSARINHHEEKFGNNLRSTVNARYIYVVLTRHRQNYCSLFSKKVVFEQHHSFLFRVIRVSISNSRRNFFNLKSEEIRWIFRKCFSEFFGNKEKFEVFLEVLKKEYRLCLQFWRSPEILKVVLSCQVFWELFECLNVDMSSF